ncbi:hypothetical protein [Streptomyces hiroshimensis]|uniref:Uncharacterized protein n=1 Tax=Streptomyces hiroshimensis TaxID=66424 RepID=A0ABQ2Z1U5_9ACTN|nr:hypothetical protein [Streptomyces hiroshimensis]GGY02184.1 hypothetical protein GCM10010324_56360 [Streptomyces hiroshimensis]
MTTPASIRILRGTDLLDLSFGFPGLKFDDPTGRRRLVRADPQREGLLVVTFGPQHVVEQVFSDQVPGESRDLPVDSRISGRSVLVFEVGPQDSIAYTEDGLLDAMRRLPMRVVDAAREPETAPLALTIRPAGGTADIGSDESDGSDGSDGDGRSATARTVALVQLLRTTAELTARYGLDATLEAAAAAGAVIEASTAAPQGTAAPEGTAVRDDTVPEGTATSEDAPAAPPVIRPQDPLADPGHPATGIELPYRLYLSPSQKGRWIHRSAITGPGPGERVELWHTRLNGATVRAVWDREGGRTPGPVEPSPFREPMTPRDRHDIVELTANGGLLKPDGQPYLPKPVDVNNLMLSAVGGWLDSLGTWPERPAGVSLSEWRHRASMGRDHYVRVMREGYLCPFGHKAVRVEVTERKFGDPRGTYLIKRVFVVVRQPLRTYDPGTPLPAGPAADSDLANVLFPFTSVRIDTVVTPDLLPPADDKKFFPATGSENPYRFKITAVDHSGRIVEFRTPLLFLDETKAFGSELAAAVAEYNRLDRNPPTAATAAAAVEVPTETGADLLGQSVALAPSAKPGDTRLEVAQMVWGMAAPPALAGPGPGNPSVSRNAQFVPQLRWAYANVPAVSSLSGADATVPVAYARRYALSGFSQATDPVRRANKGQVFLSLLTPAGSPLKLDFRNQRDRSGGLSAPSIAVAGLSRLTGPVSGVAAAAGGDPLEALANGTFQPDGFFRPLDGLDTIGPNLLGLIPLAKVIKAVEGLGKPLNVPNFFTETITAVTGFLSDLGRVRELIDHEIDRYPAAARRVVGTAEAFVRTVGDFIAERLPGRPPPTTQMRDVDNAFNAFAAALTDLLNTLPADADPGVRALLNRVRQQVATWTAAAGQAISLRDAVEKTALGARLPETVNARLEWSPAIQKYPSDLPVFVPDEGGRFSVVVDLRGSLRPDLSVGADVTCSLEKFSLLLVPAFNALQLSFTRVRFSARAGKKADIDVVLKSVDFIGPLSFVQTLRRLIPVDGFSDPPGIEVTPSGITARYALPLPNLAIGVFSLENLRLGAYLDLPFIGRTVEIGFFFCTRQAPFRLTVSLLGGGGFFGIVLTPERVAVLEAALEFGAALSMNFGVASGSLSVMAGIYYRLELPSNESRLTGYFRARGEVDVLGIVSLSIEICLELTFEPPNTVSGRARISVSVHIGFWSQSVTIECEKRFVGSSSSLSALTGEAATTGEAALPGEAAPAAAAPGAGRPVTFAEMMAPYADPVTGIRRDPVAEYCTAFAEVS